MILQHEWIEKDGYLVKTFEFEDFSEAWKFMTYVSVIAEEMDHHPLWTNLYGKVEVKLNTYDSNNKITDKDHQLAKAIDTYKQEIN